MGGGTLSSGSFDVLFVRKLNAGYGVGFGGDKENAASQKPREDSLPKRRFAWTKFSSAKDQFRSPVLYGENLRNDSRDELGRRPPDVGRRSL